MRVKYLTEDGLLMLKKNKNSVFKKIINSDESLVNYLKDGGHTIKESSIEIGETPVLDTSQPEGNEALTDAENVQRIYNHMKNLSDSQASDERIWVAYALNDQLEYMKYRWKTNTPEDMMNRYFFNYSPQRSLFRNGIARLWWIGRVTYDPKRPDPYELTKYICRDQDFIETICGRNIFNNLDILRATVAAICDSEKDGREINREVIRMVGKYVNLLAGVYIIDFVDYDTIYDKVRNYINTFNKE